MLGGILLGVRPVLAWMPDIPCVFGATDVKCVDMMMELRLVLRRLM